MGAGNTHSVPPPEAWLEPHIRALEASVRHGFRFVHLPSTGDIAEVRGFRVAQGAVDVFRARSAEDALGARFRVEDMEFSSPPALWHRCGPVAEVVTELLALPTHGLRGAPGLAAARASDLWLPPPP
ncbi:hypothetical protein [Saccharopolyspora rosea]|uniref:hypothetical protein n=1 Tax=Saccharopolyspora rosea TaxID=524884 RepID=UPI0021DA30DF|nr:hypothetical protein [Saccharopolyspora rosea]